jgi:two-component system, chemotaxis family, protein-glutamate methylesterase/glutaminase
MTRERPAHKGAGRKIRILIVDDSPTLRAVIGAVLRRAGDFEIVGEAADPLQAREAIKALNPDAITLDLEMPHMSGLDFLERLMRLRPMPVVVVSSWTQASADLTVDALALGAFECVAKPQAGNVLTALEKLPDILRAAVRSSHSISLAEGHACSAGSEFRPSDRIVAIGASTGGVESLISVISAMPENCPPTIITQHIPGTFSSSFARRMDQNSRATVQEGYEGAPLVPGRIYLAPASLDCHMGIEGSSSLKCKLIHAPPVSGHLPSVDVMFKSASAYGQRMVGVILTGMGKDGADGLLEIRKAGGTTIGQDEATSVVYGMPKAAWQIGAVEKQMPLSAISGEILERCAETGVQ